MITIEIRSPDWGVGKTTVGGLIEHLLKKFWYEVEVVTVCAPGYTKPLQYEKEERERMKGHSRSRLGGGCYQRTPIGSTKPGRRTGTWIENG